MPYLSTSSLFFSPCVKHPAPPIQPPVHAIPSIKFPISTLPTLSNAILHCSIPLQTTGFNSNSASPCSFKACLTASLNPPLLAKILP